MTKLWQLKVSTISFGRGSTYLEHCHHWLHQHCKKAAHCGRWTVWGHFYILGWVISGWPGGKVPPFSAQSPPAPHSFSPYRCTPLSHWNRIPLGRRNPGRAHIHLRGKTTNDNYPTTYIYHQLKVMNGENKAAWLYLVLSSVGYSQWEHTAFVVKGGGGQLFMKRHRGRLILRGYDNAMTWGT